MAVAETLLGRPPPPINSLSVSEYGTETVWLVAHEQSSFWKSIDADSCLPSSGTQHPICPFNGIFYLVPGPRTRSPGLAGIPFDYSANLFLIMRTEQLKMHRQVFIHREEKLNSVPLLHDIARFFEGQVASTLVVFHITPCVPDRLLVRSSKKVMLSFFSCMSCKLKFHLHVPSHSSFTSGKLSIAPDRTVFSVREEFKRLVRNNVSCYPLLLS